MTAGWGATIGSPGEYDGGRSFYTGLGHTEESFADPLYLEHLAGGIQWALGRAP